MMNGIDKENLTRKMADNLMVLRTKLRLKQSELAEKIGASRQTLLEIEKGKRTMQWNTFLHYYRCSARTVARADCLSILKYIHLNSEDIWFRRVMKGRSN